jgi:hypothetical protein
VKHRFHFFSHWSCRDESMPASRVRDESMPASRVRRAVRKKVRAVLHTALQNSLAVPLTASGAGGVLECGAKRRFPFLSHWSRRDESTPASRSAAHRERK